MDRAGSKTVSATSFDRGVGRGSGFGQERVYGTLSLGLLTGSAPGGKCMHMKGGGMGGMGREIERERDRLGYDGSGAQRTASKPSGTCRV
jgi:hypothetical protein